MSGGLAPGIGKGGTPCKSDCWGIGAPGGGGGTAMMPVSSVRAYTINIR